MSAVTVKAERGMLQQHPYLDTATFASKASCSNLSMRCLLIWHVGLPHSGATTIEAGRRKIVGTKCEVPGTGF
jgi:hypothetical protein